MSRLFAILIRLIVGAILLIIIITLGSVIGTVKNTKNLSTLSSPTIQTTVETIASPTKEVFPKDEKSTPSGSIQWKQKK